MFKDFRNLDYKIFELCLISLQFTELELGHDLASTSRKFAENIEQFENLRVLPINLRFLENDKCSLAKTFIENKAVNPVVISSVI